MHPDNSRVLLEKLLIIGPRNTKFRGTNFMKERIMKQPKLRPFAHEVVAKIYVHSVGNRDKSFNGE